MGWMAEDNNTKQEPAAPIVHPGENKLKPMTAGLDMPEVENNNPDPRLLWIGSMLVGSMISKWIPYDEQVANARRVAECWNQLNPFTHNSSQVDTMLGQLLGMFAAAGFPEPIEGFKERPQDVVGCVRDTMKELTALRARVETLEKAGQDFHDEIHDIVGTRYLNGRALMQERCAQFHAALAHDGTATKDDDS